SVANDAWPTLTAALGPETVAAPEGATYYGCHNPRTLVWYACGQLNGLLVKNNLWTNVNTGKFSTGVPYLFAVFQHEQGLQYTHNTVSGLYGKNPSGVGPSLSAGWDTGLPTNWLPFNVLIRDNVIGWTGSPSPTLGYAN